MDVLLNPTSQKYILDHYSKSGDAESINYAIERAQRHPQKTLSMAFDRLVLKHFPFYFLCTRQLKLKKHILSKVRHARV